MFTLSRITVVIRSLMPERVLNELNRRKVRMVHAHLSGDFEVVITTDPAGAAEIKKLAEEANLDFSVRQVRGLRALTGYLKKRPTLPAAFLIMAACTAFFLSRIWIIDVNILGGSVPDTYSQCIASSGARTGAAFSGIDLPLLSLDLAALDGIAYASASREGVVLRVDIAGEDAPGDIYNITHPRDLVAVCDGVIESVEVKSGTAMVKSGDTVCRGQLLISGEERISAEETHPVGALGSVKARIWSEGTASKDIRQTKKEYTGRSSHKTGICILGKTFTLSKGENFAAYDEITYSTAVGGLFLPVSINRTEKREYIPRTVTVEPQSIKDSLASAAAEEARCKMAAMNHENTEIIDKWIDFSIIDTYTLRARAVIEFSTDIAVTRRYLEDN